MQADLRIAVLKRVDLLGGIICNMSLRRIVLLVPNSDYEAFAVRNLLVFCGFKLEETVTNTAGTPHKMMDSWVGDWWETERYPWWDQD